VTFSTGIYDWCKENAYYFFGPVEFVRAFAVTAGVATAMVCSMPFDTVRNRLHTMRPLPNGKLPYTGTVDCLGKILKYECNKFKQGNFCALYTGGQAYFLRLWLIAYTSIFMLDAYHASDYKSEFWQPARFTYSSGIDYDIHNPYTDAFNQMMVRNWMAKGGMPALHPDGKSNIKVL
jgi:hypothetical protein